MEKVGSESGLPFPMNGLLDVMSPSPLSFIRLWPFQISERSDRKTPALVTAQLQGKKAG